MKQVVLAFAFLALIAVGCSEPVTEREVGSATTTDELLATVDKAGLESAIADNPMVLVEFTAEW